MKKLTHFDDQGRVNMVNITHKNINHRSATARAQLFIGKDFKKITDNLTSQKGNPFEVAKLAGIMAAKKTSALIPLCHPIVITNVDLEITLKQSVAKVLIECRVDSHSSTGPDMEALVGANIAALTFYDMIKATCPDAFIHNSGLYLKAGGKSGDYINHQLDW